MSENKQVSAKHQATDSLVSVARAVKTRGLKGEIVANLLTDFPDRFQRISELFAIPPSGELMQVRLESHWFHQGRVILKVAGYDSVEAAKALVGCEFAIPESERVELPAGEFYYWELEGSEVETVGGQAIGRVREVLRTGGVEILAVEAKERDYLIPMANSILVDVDIKRKLIRIDPPEGLLEL
jgi:16S rRNA processing protein RimM